MRKIAVSLLTVIAVFLLSVASGFGWGPDVQIYSGQINTFDVDYDLGTGTMFVAFQASGEDVIRLYSSTDHGSNWAEIASFITHPNQGTTARSDLKRLKVIYNDGRVHIFWVDSAGYLNGWVCSSTGGQIGGSRVSVKPIEEGSFSATLDLDSGRIYVSLRTTFTITWGPFMTVRYSDDNGSTWTNQFNLTAYAGPAPQSLAYGPDDHIYWAFGTQPFILPHYAIKYIRFPSSSGVMDKSATISYNGMADYDPRVAAANVNDSGVWILYNQDRGGHEIDLMNAYSADGGVTWSAPSAVDADDGIDEYIADVKFYKDPGNPYVNMVYIKDDPNATPVRQAVWMYASTGDPSWREPQVFSDEDVQSSPADTAPRIVYSPGASAPGGGVVFSYHGATGALGLYFDAPWITLGATLPVPAGQEAWNYPPVESPLLQPDPANCKPFAVGDLMTGNISLHIGLPGFSGGVDVYVGFQSNDALSPGVIYVVDETGAIVELGDGMPAWRTNVNSTAIDETLFGDIPLAGLPAGLYNLYLLVVPTGETDLSNYYFWATYFLNE